MTYTSTPYTTTPPICGCEPPWFDPKETKTILGVTDAPCYAIFGQTDAYDNKCNEAGGYTIYFTSDDQGSEGLFLQTLLSQGMYCKMIFITHLC